MDADRAREVLATVAEELPGSLLLWRGEELAGSDVDVLVEPHQAYAVSVTLRRLGLSPAVQPDGRIVWRAPGHRVVIDVMPHASWPAYYPPLAGLVRRAAQGKFGFPVASPEDRLLIYAAEAVAGRPVGHLARRISPLLAVDGVAERLSEVAAVERVSSLAELAQVLGGLGPTPGDTLLWRTSVALAGQSRPARQALRARLAGRLGRAPRANPPAGGSGRGALVTLSGIDGSGKSTTALELAASLEADGHVAWVSWSRLAADKNLLDLIALPIRRVMRRRDSIADPVAAGDLTAADAVRPVRPGWDPVAWAWVLIVSWLTVRSWRRVSRLRRRGLVVICDRWLIDALVDLEARYGRRGAAVWLLRHGVPRADLEILLEIDVDTSTRRKPGDQAPRVLEVMARRYAEAAGELGFPPAGAPARNARVTLDAREDWSRVLQAVQQHLAPRLG